MAFGSDLVKFESIVQATSFFELDGNKLIYVKSKLNSSDKCFMPNSSDIPVFNLQNCLAYKNNIVSLVDFNIPFPNHAEIIRIYKVHEMEKKQLKNTIKWLKTEKSRINCDAIFWNSKCRTLTRNYDRLVERHYVYEDDHCYAGKDVKVIPAKIDDKTKFSESVKMIIVMQERM